MTLADLAADQRALTPTEAAELLLPSSDDLRVRLLAFANRLIQPMRYRVAAGRQRLESLRMRRVMLQPVELLNDRRRMVDDCEVKAKQAVKRIRERARNRVVAVAGQLQALSPLAVLGRGYSMTRNVESGAVLIRSGDVKFGDRMVTQLAEGQVISRVEEVA